MSSFMPNTNNQSENLAPLHNSKNYQAFIQKKNLQQKDLIKKGKNAEHTDDVEIPNDEALHIDLNVEDIDFHIEAQEFETGANLF